MQSWKMFFLQCQLLQGKIALEQVILPIDISLLYSVVYLSVCRLSHLCTLFKLSADLHVTCTLVESSDTMLDFSP